MWLFLAVLFFLQEVLAKEAPITRYFARPCTYQTKYTTSVLYELITMSYAYLFKFIIVGGIVQNILKLTSYISHDNYFLRNWSWKILPFASVYRRKIRKYAWYDHRSGIWCEDCEHWQHSCKIANRMIHLSDSVLSFVALRSCCWRSRVVWLIFSIFFLLRSRIRNLWWRIIFWFSLRADSRWFAF